MPTRPATNGSEPSPPPEVLRRASPASIVGSRVGNGGVAARFATIANRTAILTGNYKTFALMLGIVLVWAITGPLFRFSTTWQLVINTGTTIITFLMVFLIQNTQNRDSLAVHLKLDEIIRAIDSADDRIIRAEDETEEELEELKLQYNNLIEESEEIEEAVRE